MSFGQDDTPTGRAGKSVPVKSKADTSDISLPTKPNVPPANFWDYSWFIYGDKGRGKSTLAAKFPNVVAHFMLEPLRRGLTIPIIPKAGEKKMTWNRFKEYGKLLIDKYPKGGRINIDTLDILAKLCEEQWCLDLNLQSIMGVNDHGKTWARVKGDWDNTMYGLMFAGFKLTFISHVRKRPKVARGVSREEMREAIEQGLVVNEIQPTTCGWAYDWSKVPVEFAGYYTTMGHEPVMHIRGHENLYASAGVGRTHFLQPKGFPRAGKPYQIIPMGHSEDEAFENLQLAWDNKLEGWFSDEEDQAEVEE